MAHRPTAADRPRRIAFADGTLRTEARLTRTGSDGDVNMGLAGSWAAGAMLVDGDEPTAQRPERSGAGGLTVADATPGDGILVNRPAALVGRALVDQDQVLVDGGQESGGMQGSNASCAATITPAASGAGDGEHRGQGGAGRHRQSERRGGAALDRRGPDAGAGSAGDRRNRACAAVAGRRRSPADAELTRPGAGPRTRCPKGKTRRRPPTPPNHNPRVVL